MRGEKSRGREEKSNTKNVAAAVQRSVQAVPVWHFIHCVLPQNLL